MDHSTELEKRFRQAAETILTNAALTASLDDSAANVLLDWGLARAKAIASRTADLDENQAQSLIQPRLTALGRLMRSMAAWVDARQKIASTQKEKPRRTLKQWVLGWFRKRPQVALDSEPLRASLQQIIEQASLVYGPAFEPPDTDQLEQFFSASLQYPASAKEILIDLCRFLNALTQPNHGDHDDQETRQTEIQDP